MTTIPNMTYGRATVEVLETNAPTHGTKLEPGPYGLVWVRHEIMSISRSRYGDGYSYDLVKSGASGWVHADNVRNFVQTHRYEGEPAGLVPVPA